MGETRFWHLIAIAAILFEIETTEAGEIQGLGTAIGKALGATKGVVKTEVKTKSGTIDVYIGGKKKNKRYAFVQKGTYPPDCTHTWIIALNASNLKVASIQPVEMSCHHAYPTYREKWFYRQYVGKGPAQLKTLKKVKTIAKATGSSDLTTDAVRTSIELAKRHRKKF